MNCAVFASGSGSNFQALIDRREAGDLHAGISLLVGNNSKAGAFERAARHGIPSVHCAPSRFPDEITYVRHLAEILETHRIELLVLAGYMKKLPIPLIRRYTNRIINIHPALLPSFGGAGMYGSHVHEAVIRYGAKISGVTVHFVSEEYDTGPVILQETVPVLDDDTPESLARRVLCKEHQCLWRAVEAVASGHLTVRDRRVYGSV